MNRRAKRKETKAVRPIRIARHEAAHAVVAEHLGWPVVRVELHRRRDTRGGSLNELSKTPCAFEQALICLAGDAAERLWHRQSARYLSAGDARNVYRIPMGARAVATLQMHADGLVRELAEPIERVAQELKRRNLTGDDVRRLMAIRPVRARRTRK